MKNQRYKPLATLALGLLLSGCFGGANYASSYSMNDVQATPPSLMVAQKLKLPLYIVVDPTKVKDSWRLTVGKTTPSETGFDFLNFQTFVKRDLKTALSSYFNEIHIVEPGAARSSGPHWIADVKVDYVRMHDLVTGQLTYTTIQMSWGIALRPSSQDEYLVSFAGVGISRESYRTFEEGAGQMVESAISSMNKSWSDDEVLNTLKAAEAEAHESSAPIMNEVSVM